MGDGDAGRDKPRILIVDDSKVIRFAAKKILGGEYDVVAAEDGEEGWYRVNDDPAIGVIFSDLSMPNVDGFGLLERIRSAQEERINNLPVIIVTSGEGEEIRQRAHELGATDFITKPFDSVTLLARAKAHATSRQINVELRKKATVDPVTGLHDRAYLLEQFQKDRSLAKRHQQPLSMVFLELAAFRDLFLKNGKEISYGVLCKVADLIRGQVRQEDTAARIGLAQFAFSLPMTDATGARKLAERLRIGISQTSFALRTNVVPVSPALAVAMLTADRDIGADTVIGKLESKVADAIKEGRNGVVLAYQDSA